MSGASQMQADPHSPELDAPELDSVDLPAGPEVICDLHLDLGLDEPSAALVRYLDGLESAPRLIVLGDLFDYWVGPAQLSMRGAPRILDAFSRLTARGAHLDVLLGNRDFLLDRHFVNATGATLRPNGLIGVGEDGKRTLFVHGDELCTKDVGYQKLRRVLRSKPVRWLGPRLPFAVSRRIAERLRKASRGAVAAKPSEETAMQQDACESLARSTRADTLVCGHAHVFRDERIEADRRWLVLDSFGGKRDSLRIDARGQWQVRSAS